MKDQHQRDTTDHVKPLSLESAIFDVAPRIVGSEAKPSQPQPTSNRPHPIGRISLRPPE